MARQLPPPPPPPPAAGRVRTTPAPSRTRPTPSAAPAAPPSNINQPPPPSKLTYADLVEGVRLAWPGKYDDADPRDLAEVVLEVYPQLGERLDRVTAGTELLPPEQGGPRRSADFLKTKQGQFIPKPPPAPATSVPMTDEVRRHIERRPATLGDQLVTGGIRVAGGIAAPLVAGATAAGGAVAVPFTAGASIPVTLAAPAMGIATGAAFEGLAQGYEQAAGISDEISPLNMLGQGALNMVPIAPALQRGARVLGAVTAGAAPKVSAALARAGAASGLPARMAGNVIEGAVASTTGSALETMTEQNRLPSLEEVGTAATIGAGFGAGFGAIAEVGKGMVGRARTARGQKMTAAAHSAMDAAEQLSGGILPREGQEALRLEVVKVLQEAQRLDPVGTKGAATRLMQILDNSKQADLQARAAAFLSAFAEQSPHYQPQQRLDIAHQFLLRIKEDGLTPDGMDQIVRTLAGIDTAGRMADAANPAQKFLPAPKSAPGLVMGADGIERVADVPYDPDFQPQRGGLGVDPVQDGPPQYTGPTVPFVVDPEGSVRRAGSVYEGTAAATPPQLPRYEYDSATGRIVELPPVPATPGIEQRAMDTGRNPNPRAIGLLRDVSGDPRVPRPGDPPPIPEVDFRESKMPDVLAAEAAEAAAREAAELPGKLAAATTPDLPGVPEVPAGMPKRTPRRKQPKPPMYPSRGDVAIAQGAPPPPPKVGVHTLPRVKDGSLSPEEAALLRLIGADVREFGFEQGVGRTDAMRADDRADGRTEFEKERASPRVPSTYMARTIARIAGYANPDSMNRGQLRSQIDTFLNGKREAAPGKLAAAAVRYAALLRKAWNPTTQRFEKGRLSGTDLKGTGVSFKDLHFPNLPPSMALAMDEADDILELFAPNLLAERQALLAEGAPVAAKEAAEAQTHAIPPGRGAEFLAGLSDAELRALNDELQGLGPDAAGHRQWVTQAMEDRGLARPRQAVLGVAPDRLLPMLPEAPSRRVLQLDEALATPEGVDATADLVNSRAAAADELAAIEREGPAVPDDPMPEGFGTLPDAVDDAVIARRAALRQQLAPFAQKSGLTAAEAEQYRALSRELANTYFAQPEPTVKAMGRSALPEEVIRPAFAAARTSQAIFEALNDSAAGVYHAQETPVDQILAGRNPLVSPGAFVRAFEPVRQALRGFFGKDPTSGLAEGLTLWRVEGKQIAKATKNYALTAEEAAKYGPNPTLTFVPYDRILAVNVGPTGSYHEFIVAESGPARALLGGKDAPAPKTAEPPAFPGVPEAPPAPSMRPNLFDLSDETGAVGNVARAKAARAKQLRDMVGTKAAPADLRVSQAIYNELEAAVAKAGDDEAVGLLLGSADGQVQRVILTRNIAVDPSRTFQIAPETIAAAQAKAKTLGLEVLGSFHSQPGGSATPSRADLRGGVADLPMLIVGTKAGQIRDVGVWQPQGKARFAEGSISLGEGTPRGGLPAKVRPIKAAIKKIPNFRGAMGDAPALGQYLEDFADELGNEPFFAKAQAALEAGDARKAWLELQIGQVAYGNVTKEAIGRLDVDQQPALRDKIASLESGSAQSGAGQLWALYNGRTVYVEGVGRIVVTPDLPPALADTGVTAGPGGVLRPPTPTAALPDHATRTRMSLAVVNQVIKDLDPDLIVDDPTKISATRLFRQTAEQMMLAPHRFAAMKALGVSPEQAAGHFQEVVSESARILASLSAWKRANQQAIARIEGITGADGTIRDLQVIGKGRKVGRLSDLTPERTFDELLAPKNSWEKVILMQTLTPGQIGKFDQFGRASRGFMLAQWATALRNVYSATARWGADGVVSTLQAMAYGISGDTRKAMAALAKTGDLIRYAPVIRPDTWVMPWNARQAEWEQIFRDGGVIFSMLPAERRQVLNALLSMPERAAHFIGGTNFGEELRKGTSGSTILDTLAKPEVQNTLTLFNRAQEFTIRSAMLNVSLNHQLRLKGLNPAKALSLPPEALRQLLGEDAFTQVFDAAVGESMDFTFAGDLIRRGFGRSAEGTHQAQGAWNTQIIDIINRIPMIREGYPFGKFNLSAAPRYLWDHSGIGLFLDPLYSAVAKRGRYHLGKQSKTFRDALIPQADQKIAAARLEAQQALAGWQGIKDELTARKRLAAQHRRLTVEAAGLPEIAGKVEANRTALEALEDASRRYLERYEIADDNLKALEAQKRTLQETVAQAAAANAPEDFQTLFARNMAGAAVMLPLAMMLRADQRDKGTPWYKYKLPNSDVQLDLRPMAPFVQYLFVADVLQDFYDYTDWGGVLEDLEQGKYTYDELGSKILTNGRYEGRYGDDVGMMAVAHALMSSNLQGILDTPSSIYAHYEGKYTAASLGRELAQVAVSTSQIAGTTLSLVDAVLDITEQGLPSPKKIVNLMANTMGQMLARYTIPMGQFKSVSDLYDDQESMARIADTEEDYSVTGLAQALGNLPFVGAATIPETYNQLTGQPLDTFQPLLRSIGGVTAQRWNRVVGEIADIGLPGPSVYIRKTGDKYLDTLIGYHYARLVQQYVPAMLDSEQYRTRTTPALRRDFLSPQLARLKKAAISLAGMDAGADRIKVAREGTEAGRRKQREARLRQLILEENLPAEDPVEEEVGLPDLPEELETPETDDLPMPQ